MSAAPPPEAPEDRRERAFLAGVARLAAGAWLKEASSAKGWHGEWVKYEPEPPEGT